MNAAPAEPSWEDNPDLQHSLPKAECEALVHKMAEPLTALTAYIEAALHLNETGATSARADLAGILSKTQAQIARATEVLQQLRQLLDRAGN